MLTWERKPTGAEATRGNYHYRIGCDLVQINRTTGVTENQAFCDSHHEAEALAEQWVITAAKAAGPW